MSDVFNQRTTSAGYRLPLSTRPKTAGSEYHQSCVPAESRRRAEAAAAQQQGASGGKREEPTVDVVTQDEIWKQSVATEQRGAKSWEQNWGFLTEFDPKGRPKTAREVPEDCVMYSENVPNTQGSEYGSRLNTEVGQDLQRMEFQFNSHRRRKKLGNDLICY